jgi:hypothetical protein
MGGGIMLATLAMSFTAMSESSEVIPLADQDRIAVALEEDAQVVSDTQLQEVLAGQPREIQDEILRINDDARSLSLQVALLVPLLACLVGLFNAFRMVRLPDVEPTSSAEGSVLR